MIFAPSFELGYVAPVMRSNLSQRALKRISEISGNLASLLPDLSNEHFRPQVYKVGRINSGLSEYTPFARFPEVEFEKREQPGPFLTRPYLDPAFDAFILGFCQVGDRMVPKRIERSAEFQKKRQERRNRFNQEVLEAAKLSVGRLGIPDFFTQTPLELKSGDVGYEFALWILPQIEAIPAALTDLLNKYVAVVVPTENAQRHHSYTKGRLIGTG